MEQTNIELDQDGIYSLLKHFLWKKGMLSESEAQRVWDHEHERVYKEFCYFGLGIPHPIVVPTSEKSIPARLTEDPVWKTMMDPDGVDDSDDGSIKNTVGEPVGGPPDGMAQQSDPGSPDATKINVAENGDLSFVLKTGTHQPKIPTEVESLATEVVSTTEKVGDEISTGEEVTKKSIAADRVEEMSEDEPDVPPPTREQDSEQDDLDDLDKID